MAEDVYTIRHTLAMMFKAARLKAGMTQADVARETMWSTAKVCRYEKGDRAPVPSDYLLVLPMFGITGEAIAPWLAMAKRARQRSMYAEFADILAPQQVEYYDILESIVLLRETSDLIPLLLRTDAYCLAMDRASHKASQVPRWQMLNQMVRSTSPTDRTRRLSFILGETCLWRLVGGVEVMHEQMNYLWVLNRRPNVDIRIVPFEAGLFSGLIQGYSLLFHDQEAPATLAVHRWPHDPCVIERSPARITELQRAWDQMEPASVHLDSMLPQVLARLAA